MFTNVDTLRLVSLTQIACHCEEEVPQGADVAIQEYRNNKYSHAISLSLLRRQESEHEIPASAGMRTFCTCSRAQLTVLRQVVRCRGFT